MKKAISVLESLWMQLDLSITPQFCILTTYTIKQIKRIGGIADKVKDFVVNPHQVSNKLDELVAHIKSQCFCQQELGQNLASMVANRSASFQSNNSSE